MNATTAGRRGVWKLAWTTTACEFAARTISIQDGFEGGEEGMMETKREANVLENPVVVRLLSRITAEAAYGLRCRESRQSCQRIIDIVSEVAHEFADELVAGSR